ncbi:MAG TPA: hypothetical protein VG225_16865 [Terracidiphilus sp.]|jgi:hypothetical protein|nr:hypothetical protein [Terracidiphilus sp.]
MQESLDQQWRRLTAYYAGLWDEELLNVAADYKDLTEMAQQVLRDEMKRRGLGNPSAIQEPPSSAALPPSSPAAVHWIAQGSLREPESALPEDGDEQPREYTWKVPLCDCEDQEQARQMAEALRRNGIERWIEARDTGFVPGFPSPPRIVVAADQLEAAQRIAAQPIPQDIIEQSKMDVPEFAMPKCPQCGRQEPVLMATEPANAWQCQACGKEWSEPPGEANQA